MYGGEAIPRQATLWRDAEYCDDVVASPTIAVTR